MKFVVTAFVLYFLKIKASCDSRGDEEILYDNYPGKHFNKFKNACHPFNSHDNSPSGFGKGICVGSSVGSSFNLRDMGRGHLDDDFMIDIGSGVNHGQGICSKRTILQLNYSYMLMLLRQFEQCYKNTGYGNHHNGYILPNSEHLRHKLYDIFYDCLYLVDSCYFHKYYTFFKCRDFETCFYIIRRSLKPCDVVREYSFVISNLPKTSELYGTDIYSSVNSCILRPILTKVRRTRICTADFICDVKAVVCLDLLERIDLIHLFFHTHFNSRIEDTLISKHIEEFLIIYRRIFMRGNKLDHVITAIVITKLYGDLNFAGCDISVITNLTSWLCKYYMGSFQREVQFICKIGLGRSC
ncbi:hypothetical protein NAPIS_ORF00254 [Vairimorpha apis BRL 01]|uniref:Uncharacterized protein n=1 Tax=Vairimorpha apis BRL 01 TaxID=1037528 RepID=T0LCZ1_9MICR|nr:hypothetical protein NAPIS_ORF00254 [Vairimorpha apis BRL 01]